MRVAYVGNFGVPFTTENEVARALEANGHEVVRLQENVPETWDVGGSDDLPWAPATTTEPDLLLWTRTGWDWEAMCGWKSEEAHRRQRLMLDTCAALNIRTVGYHLDRWWGLNREGQVADEPFFRVDLLCTADGGHQAEWEAAGVRHRWFPPAVSEFECAPGTPRPEFTSDIAFVGSWRPGYHREWKHRPQLVSFLSRYYRRRVKFWPEAGKPAVRLDALRDLYASTKVIVGDSCLVGAPCCYWSDRIPETLGRGGFLLHPYVAGIEDHFTDGEHLRLWQVGDWPELRRLISYYLEHDDERRRIAEQGRAHVLEHHTYTVRMQQLEKLLADEGLIR